MAFAWRRLLFKTTFIAISGSVGKTTCKECLAGILSRRYRTVRTDANQNDFLGVPRTLLRTRPWDRYAVVEAGTDQPGAMRRLARLIRPDIVVMLCVDRAHIESFRTLESMAAEKAELPASLRRGGVAVLNGDDRFVTAMPVPAGVRVVRFGDSPGGICRAEGASSIWPERLQFRLVCSDSARVVRSKLVGEHWLPSLMGAAAAALACGVALDDVAAGIEATEPVPGRMQPVVLPGGAVMFRDEKGAQWPTVAPALRVLREARASRRILVSGDVSSVRMKPRERLRRVGIEAARAADVAVFVGSHGEHAHRAAIQNGMRPENVCHFLLPEQAAGFLREILAPGDVVLLKGRCSQHLSRVYFAQLGEVACRRLPCPRRILCDLCPELHGGAGARSRPDV